MSNHSTLLINARTAFERWGFIPALLSTQLAASGCIVHELEQRWGEDARWSEEDRWRGLEDEIERMKQ